jgi:hypothetical protein
VKIGRATTRYGIPKALDLMKVLWGHRPDTFMKSCSSCPSLGHNLLPPTTSNNLTDTVIDDVTGCVRLVRREMSNIQQKLQNRCIICESEVTEQNHTYRLAALHVCSSVGSAQCNPRGRHEALQDHCPPLVPQNNREL